MRDSYREQLDDILADLVHMAQVVSSTVRSSTTPCSRPTSGWPSR